MRERIPTQRPALGRGAGRVAREESADGSLVGEDRGSVYAARRNVGIPGEDPLRFSSSVPDPCPCRGEQAASMNREAASSREATLRLSRSVSMCLANFGQLSWPGVRLFQARKKIRFDSALQVGTALPADWVCPARSDFTIGKNLFKNQATMTVGGPRVPECPTRPQWSTVPGIGQSACPGTLSGSDRRRLLKTGQSILVEQDTPPQWMTSFEARARSGRDLTPFSQFHVPWSQGSARRQPIKVFATKAPR